MHERHRPPSQPSALAVQSPIFPGEYSQFCPSLVQAAAGFCGEPSLVLLAGGHAARASVTVATKPVALMDGDGTLVWAGMWLIRPAT